MDIHCIWLLDVQLKANLLLELLKKIPRRMVSQIYHCFGYTFMIYYTYLVLSMMSFLTCPALASYELK
jgi:hypothetical protein